MKITFDKRTYIIEDGEDKYEVIHIIKHPTIENIDSYHFYKYVESDVFEDSGYWYFEPSDELVDKIKKTIESYE